MITGDTITTEHTNATVKRSRPCSRCSKPMAVGSRCLMFRERALSSHEACHGGLYPWRYLCVGCALKRATANRGES